MAETGPWNVHVPRVLVVTEVGLMGGDPAGTASDLLHALRDAGPAAALQWREKTATARDLYRRLLALSGRPGPELRTPEDPGRILVNDRVDVALALGLGVHLTEGSLPTRVVRSLLPGGRCLGRSVHDPASARRAEIEGADYVVFGPVWETPSKKGLGEPQGLARLASVAREIAIPVLAIGGIDPERARACREAGAHGVAAIRAIWEAASPESAVRALLAATAETSGGR